MVLLLKVVSISIFNYLSKNEQKNASLNQCTDEELIEFKKLNEEYKKKFLGKIPINIDLRIAADTGKPLFEKDPNHKISKIFREIANKVKGSFL